MSDGKDIPNYNMGLYCFWALVALFVVIIGYLAIDVTTENYGTITIADITDWSEYEGDVLVKDTDGRIWVLYYQDRFERDDCAIGQTLDIQWRGLNPEPRGYEKATVLRVVK